MENSRLSLTVFVKVIVFMVLTKDEGVGGIFLARVGLKRLVGLPVGG